MYLCDDSEGSVGEVGLGLKDNKIKSKRKTIRKETNHLSRAWGIQLRARSATPRERKIHVSILPVLDFKFGILILY